MQKGQVGFKYALQGGVCNSAMVANVSIRMVQVCDLALRV